MVQGRSARETGIMAQQAALYTPPRRVLRILFWLVLAASLVLGAVLMVLGHEVPGLGVLLSGTLLGVVLGVLAYSGSLPGRLTRKQLRRNGMALVVTGVVIASAGVVFVFFGPGDASQVLVVPGVGLALGGAITLVTSSSSSRSDAR